MSQCDFFIEKKTFRVRGFSSSRVPFSKVKFVGKMSTDEDFSIFDTKDDGDIIDSRSERIVNMLGNMNELADFERDEIRENFEGSLPEQVGREQHIELIMWYINCTMFALFGKLWMFHVGKVSTPTPITLEINVIICGRSIGCYAEPSGTFTENQ